MRKSLCLKEGETSIIKNNDNFINISETRFYKENYQQHKGKFYSDHGVTTVVDTDGEIYITRYTQKMYDFLIANGYKESPSVLVPLTADEAMKVDTFGNKFKELYEKSAILPISQQIYANFDDSQLKEHFLNKPNMTPEDKLGMEKSIDYLIANNMKTQENFRKLDRIYYTPEYIEIGGVKRSRKNISADPDGQTIFQIDGVTYFLSDRNVADKQNEILINQQMTIPSSDDFIKSMNALPIGDYIPPDKERKKGQNILGYIINLPMNGVFREGRLEWKNKGGFYFATINDKKRRPGRQTERYRFDHDNGRCFADRAVNYATPIRPIYI